MIKARFSDGQTIQNKSTTWHDQPFTHGWRVRGVTELAELSGFSTSEAAAKKRVRTICGDLTWHHGSTDQPWLKKFEIEIVPIVADEAERKEAA